MLFIAIAVDLFLAQTISSLTMPPPLCAKARLIFMDTAETCPKINDLAKCRDLTVEAYRQHGAEVLRKTLRDLEGWLSSAGKRFAKAEQCYRYIAYANSLHGDMIGGVSYYAPSPSDTAGVDKIWGPQFYGWGYNVRACEQSVGVPMEENGTRIGPRRLSTNSLIPPSDWGKEQSWSIQTKLLPLGRFLWSTGLRRGAGFQAMIGIEFESTENRVLGVSRGTPASKLGIGPGDLIMSLNGKQIRTRRDASDVMLAIKQGERVEVTWKHDDRVQMATVDPINSNDYSYEHQAAFFGKETPNLEAMDINGKKVSPNQLKGSIVVLNFWATWCGPCRTELPCLQMMAEELSTEPVVWLNVSVDENEEAWRRFVSDNCLSGVQIRAPQWARQFFVSSFPTTYIIDTNGILREEVRSNAAPQALGLVLEHREQVAKREKRREARSLRETRKATTSPSLTE